MKYLLLLSLLFITVYSQRCLPSEFAQSRLTSGPATEYVNVTVTELSDRYIFNGVNFTLSTSNGGPETSRGLLIVPDLGVHGGSYSHYAWEMALIGHHVVIMKSIDGLSEIEIFGKMIELMETDLDLHAWALLGHGYSGKLVQKFAKIDNGSRIKSIIVLGSPLIYDFTDGKRQVLVMYGLRDEVHSVEEVENSIRLHGSYETYVQALDVSHMGFAFADCVQESDYRFESNNVPVFELPMKTGSTEILNHHNKILPNKPQISILCGASKVEYLDGSNWYDIGTSVIDVTSRLTHVLIEVKTGRPEYEDLTELLSDKKVRITFKCGLFSQFSQIEFYVNSKPQPEAEQHKNSFQMVANLAMGLMAWRNGTAEAIHCGYDRIIEKPGNLIPTRWYVWDNENATRGIIMHMGGALHPLAYNCLARKFQEKGYLVVAISAVSRFSMLAVGQGKKVIAEFPQIEKWTLNGQSQGGYSAAMEYAYYPDEKYDSIIMFAGVISTLDFSNSDVLLVNIYGLLDTVGGPDPHRYQTNFGNLYNPNRTHFVPVENANHCYTADYEFQKGDSFPTISRREQQEIMVNIFHDYVSQLDSE